jgi:hypothetical protein
MRVFKRAAAAASVRQSGVIRKLLHLPGRGRHFIVGMVNSAPPAPSALAAGSQRLVTVFSRV